MIQSFSVQSSSSSDVQVILDHLWDLRNEGYIERAKKDFLNTALDFGTDLSASPSNKVLHYLERGLCSEHAVDLVLLESSFHRAELNPAKARLEMESLKDSSQASFLTGYARYHLQMGLNEWALGQYSTALSLYAQARRVAQDIKVQTFAHLNWILAVEVLGYPIDDHIAEFKTSLKKVQNQKWAGNVLSQFQALELRTAFKKSNLQELQRLCQEKLQGEQSLFLQRWLYELPQWNFSAKNSAAQDLLQEQWQKGNFWLNNFRARTFEGLLIQEDLAPQIKLEAKITRLYLWLWRWLKEPEWALTEKIQILNSNIQENLKSQNIPAVTLQMYRNTLLWLGLFKGTDFHSSQRQLVRVQSPHGEAHGLLDYEFKVVEFLYALRDRQSSIAEDLKVSLKSHLFAKSKMPIMSLLAGTADLGALQSYVQRQLQAVNVVDGVFIDATSLDLLRVYRGKKMWSQNSGAMARLLISLMQMPTVAKSDLCMRCFELNHYDSDLHGPKLANLISKAHQLLPEDLRIKIRQDRVLLIGHKEQIYLRNVSLYSDLLKSVRGTVNDAEKDLALSYTRKEIEDLFNLSKATANRRILEWMKQGQLRREGLGKSSRYFLSEDLLRQSEELK